jgi:hypothetical protein
MRASAVVVTFVRTVSLLSGAVKSVPSMTAEHFGCRRVGSRFDSGLHSPWLGTGPVLNGQA